MNECHPALRFRFCPYCGSPRFTWDGEKSHHCADCGHKLYTNEVGAVIAVITNAEGEVLFVRRRFNPAKGTLDLPGGFIDLGERAEDAMRREVMEELHLRVTRADFLCTLPNTYVYDTLMYHTIDIVFHCEVEDWSALRADDDATECRFLPLENVDVEAVGLDSVRRLVGMLKQGEIKIK
ncbi:MAG: NUDIX domain-containing protein [Bacteroidales bacterium]|nr:NUDIX domain-containing protein [Bacteroidales bacterium]